MVEVTRMSPSTRRLMTGALLACALVSVARHAAAQSCTSNSLSTCIDANALWPSEGNSHFVSLDSTTSQSAGSASLGLALQYLSNPISLNAPGPDPFGTELEAVENAFDASLLAAIGLLPRLEATVALPFVVLQSGNGVSPATSQQATPITSSTLRDPRLGLGFDLFGQKFDDLYLSAKLSHRIALPLGDETAFAGERGVVNAPALAFALHMARFVFATQVGARLRAPVRLGDARHGHQLAFSLGTSWALLDREKLSLSLEAWALPGLVSQVHTLPSGAQVDASQVPAEWSLAVRSLLTPDLLLQVAGGTAIPLSSRTRTAQGGGQSDERFAAMTAAEFRMLAALRYTLR